MSSVWESQMGSVGMHDMREDMLPLSRKLLDNSGRDRYSEKEVSTKRFLGTDKSRNPRLTSPILHHQQQQQRARGRMPQRLNTTVRASCHSRDETKNGTRRDEHFGQNPQHHFSFSLSMPSPKTSKGHTKSCITRSRGNVSLLDENPVKFEDTHVHRPPSKT
jgi:hypothetical protein